MLRAFLITLALVLLAAGGLVVSHVAWPSVPGPLSTVIGGRPLVIPGEFLRTQGEALSAGKVDVAAMWPGFIPLALNGQDPEGAVFMTLSGAETAAGTLDNPLELYARFFADENWTNPGGLAMRRFRADTPYHDEELYFTPPDGEAFAARCPRRHALTDVGKQTCLWRLRQGNLVALVRFSPRLLPAWARLKAGVLGLLDQWSTQGAS